MERTDRHGHAASLGWTLVAIGVCLTATAGATYWDMWAFQQAMRQVVAREHRASTSAGEEATAGHIGFPWILSVPRLDLSVSVLEGTAPETLQVAAGHILGTARPGSPGTTGIAAHRDTLFRPLRRIRAGDALEIRTAGRRFGYVVTSTTVVAPGDTRVLASSSEERVVLVTCYPFWFVGAAPHRFVVFARRVESPVRPPAPGLRPEER
ncbi:hypothetical protein TBR22_A42820 [Luteitalea sp. TBR-22]|uniref:class D sortase n=1 Tax=Luteitalea sp. TBR-22 TaxID=2802971 RepID=UPI001AF609EC|nr:class D sortase [Luteitalea sp. TBR-22]BCS35056.1 hypothetical protein TBR22_A42820 [Luteitalea sp. TBR-22]